MMTIIIKVCAQMFSFLGGNVCSDIAMSRFQCVSGGCFAVMSRFQYVSVHINVSSVTVFTIMLQCLASSALMATITNVVTSLEYDKK